MIIATNVFAGNASQPRHQNLLLQKRSGFFRFSFDNIKMPGQMTNMGLLGLNYFANITPEVYGGIGGYGSVIGTQGGLFVLGIEGGYQHKLVQNLWGDIGFFVGGGGGRSSLVGGGLMVRPHAGFFYQFPWAQLGLYYSYISFPSGEIHSNQIGADVNIPFDFFYVATSELSDHSFGMKQILLPDNQFLNFERNDFALILQRYQQRKGTLNIRDEIQDQPIDIIGAEFDHYIADEFFWYVKAGGAFSGIP